MFYEDFEAFCRQEYAILEQKNLNLGNSKVSPYVVEIKRSDFDLMGAAIRAFEELSTVPKYQEHVRSQLPSAFSALEPCGAGLFMGFDFHLSPQGPQLIEINTNAGFPLGVDLLNRFHLQLGVKGLHYLSARKKFLEDFNEEYKRCRAVELRQSTGLVICDENIAEQAMAVEFELFKELLEKNTGVACRIGEVQDFKSSWGDFVYNRHTDFYLERPVSNSLKKAYLEGVVGLSPSPWNFALLADKRRLIDFNRAGFLEEMQLSAQAINAIRKVLIATFSFNDPAARNLWAERKDYFFKPSVSFGGKAAYSGRKITKKVWDELGQRDTIVQKWVPAPELEVEGPEGPETFKYDLRVYAYKGEVRLLAARLYEGQTTNFRTPRGGFAAVQLRD